MLEKKTVFIKDIDPSSIKIFEMFGWVLVGQDKRKLEFERKTNIKNYDQLKTLGDEYYFGKKKNVIAIWIIVSILAFAFLGIGNPSGVSDEGFAYIIGYYLGAPALIGFIPYTIIKNKDKKKFDKNKSILEEVNKLKENI
jgi:hypothetical protein